MVWQVLSGDDDDYAQTSRGASRKPASQCNVADAGCPRVPGVAIVLRIVRCDLDPKIMAQSPS
jgi:hypothetical protein